jgi:hypothetical protein
MRHSPSKVSLVPVRIERAALREGADKKNNTVAHDGCDSGMHRDAEGTGEGSAEAAVEEEDGDFGCAGGD